MRLESMEALFLHEVKDLYSAEKQLTKALPKMAKKAASPQLKRLIEAHLKETEKQVQRLEKILGQLDQSTRGPKCKAMEGLIAEGGEVMSEEGDERVKDAALIGAAQRVEHYEIAAYGTARTFAQLLGYDEAADLLEQTLAEEKAADEKLNDLALSDVNAAAQHAS